MPHPVDEHVGKRLRLRRNLLGLSQDELGKSVSITFQQVQKYERGSNRISASRLFELAKVMAVPVNYFFEGMEGAQAAGFAEEGQAGFLTQDLMESRESYALLQAYYKIESPELRQKVMDLIRAMQPIEATAAAEE